MKKNYFNIITWVTYCLFCSNPKAKQNDVKLAPPTDVRSGYIRLVKNVNYYIDWIDLGG